MHWKSLEFLDKLDGKSKEMWHYHTITILSSITVALCCAVIWDPTQNTRVVRLNQRSRPLHCTCLSELDCSSSWLKHNWLKFDSKIINNSLLGCYFLHTFIWCIQIIFLHEAWHLSKDWIFGEFEPDVVASVFYCSKLKFVCRVTHLKVEE